MSMCLFVINVCFFIWLLAVCMHVLFWPMLTFATNDGRHTYFWLAISVISMSVI